MAKSNTIQVKLVSSANTGFLRKQNPKSMSEKLELKKYDPKVRKHVIFKSRKLSSFFFFSTFNSIPSSLKDCFETMLGDH